MFLKKLGKRGVAMTEYAVLLAFVAAVAGSFTSDNGLASSITAAIGKAENAINMAMGGESSTSPINRAPLQGEYSDELQSGVNALVDGIYDAYKQNGYSLRTLQVDRYGNLTKATYWNEDGSYSELTTENKIPGNYNDFLEGTGCTFAVDNHGSNTTQLFYNESGSLVMPMGPGERGKLTGGMYPRIVIEKDGHQYCIETHLWNDAVVNKEDSNTYLNIQKRY